MTLEERANLILAVTKVLFVNGQSTEQTVAAAERLGGALGVRARILPRWGELQLQVQDNGGGSLISAVTADPTNVAMGRVASAMRLIEGYNAAHVTPESAIEKTRAISLAPPAPTWLFAFAAAAGAAALAVIFGVQHLAAAFLILVSAGAGAVLRRGLAHYVLVPGPPVLNGALDLIRGRIHLGAARVIYAGLVVIAISTGLLLGLTLLDVSLPVDQVSRVVPLWQDMIAAGIAVAAYGFFSPCRCICWHGRLGLACWRML